MTTIFRFPCLAFVLTCCFGSSVASPTSNEYAPCHKLAAYSLTACLEQNPGYVNDKCWKESKRQNDACYAGVRESHRPDKAKIAAMKKAEAAHMETQAKRAPQAAKSAACTGTASLMLWDRIQDVAPASQVQARVYRAHRPGYIEDVPQACVDAWEIDTTPHAAVDKNGLIKIQAGAPDGTLITVTAVVGDERVSGKVRAFDASRHPLRGSWKQVGEHPCDATVERIPYDPIMELVFDAGGRFSVTQRPFESYKDYWGEYSHDVASGAVTFSNTKGNKVPPDLQLQGSAKVAGNELVLNDVVLWPAPDGVKLCSLRFTR
ncbi:MAG: hypothetical protein V4857_16865 [Pseudomonadota bacterium]